GVGSAVNDATRLFGAALGVAVTGSVAASLYSSRLDQTIPHHLPARAVNAADGSVGGALVAAHNLQHAGFGGLAHQLNAAATPAAPLPHRRPPPLPSPAPRAPWRRPHARAPPPPPTRRTRSHSGADRNTTRPMHRGSPRRGCAGCNSPSPDGRGKVTGRGHRFAQARRAVPRSSHLARVVTAISSRRRARALGGGTESPAR